MDERTAFVVCVGGLAILMLDACMLQGYKGRKALPWWWALRIMLLPFLSGP